MILDIPRVNTQQMIVSGCSVLPCLLRFTIGAFPSTTNSSHLHHQQPILTQPASPLRSTGQCYLSLHLLISSPIASKPVILSSSASICLSLRIGKLECRTKCSSFPLNSVNMNNETTNDQLYRDWVYLNVTLFQVPVRLHLLHVSTHRRILHSLHTRSTAKQAVHSKTIGSCYPCRHHRNAETTPDVA